MRLEWTVLGVIVVGRAGHGMIEQPRLRAGLLISPRSVQATQQQSGCKGTVHRQFDFWAGDWDVTTQDGKPAGKNVIKVIQDGCALQENWTGASGGTGTSINYVNGGRWHQLWVSNRGDAFPLEMSGALQGTAMVMTGDYVRPDGKRVKARMRWQPLEQGRVRQVWENSEDGGATWTTVFDGVYKRMPGTRR